MNTKSHSFNFLTIDLEDWHQCYKLRYNLPEKNVSIHIDKQINSLLNLLDKNSVKATFFCLAKLAEERPDIIRLIDSCNHEIQSHGYSHKKVCSMNENEFRNDLFKSKKILEDITGKSIIGFRAPEFSINTSCKWAFKVLRSCGYKYDSSVFPLKMPRYGWPNFPKSPTAIDLGNNEKIIEFPLFSTIFFKNYIPLSGGGYFRLLPWFLISYLIRKDIRNEKTFYFHPYEIGCNYLNIRECSNNINASLVYKINFIQNLFRKTMLKKISKLLYNRKFITLGEYVERTKPKSTILFSEIS